MKTITLQRITMRDNRKRCHVVSDDTDDVDHSGTYVLATPEVLAAPALLKELEHLVNLLEPIEYGGDLAVPGLATLNGARAAIAAARGE